MRDWINLFESMSVGMATRIFAELGINTASMSKEELKSAYRKLMMKHHPDRGGELIIAQQLSQAYETLKGNVGAESSKQAPKSSPNHTMERENFRNLNYIKWWFSEKSKDSPSQEWTVMSFDGYFFRNSFSVRGNPGLFSDMSRAMVEWDHTYDRRAILAGSRQMLEHGKVLLIWADGQDITPPKELTFDSFNLNPANDPHFSEELRGICSSSKVRKTSL